MDKWKPDAAQREILEGLKREAAKENSQADFARRYLDISPEVYSKIVAALDDNPDRRSYFDDIKTPNALMEELGQKLASVMVRRARETEMERIKILPLSRHEKVVTAVRQCLKKTTCERLIVFRAPTGGGKTMLCARLEREFDARIAFSRQAWTKSYFSFLTDIASAIGFSLGGECRPSRMEQAIIRHCRLNAFVLVIDEAEYFGGDALNGIKLLLNETLITVVINVIPEAHDKWSTKHAIQARQLERRQHKWLEQRAVSVDDAALFFPSGQFSRPLDSLKMIAESASAFGHFSFIKTVADKLENVRSADEKDVKKAVNAALRRVRKPVLLGEKEEED